MLKSCAECKQDYIGNKNGKYCSVKCAAKNRPTQYQKNKAKLDAIKNLVTHDHETKEQFINRVKEVLYG